MDSWSHGLPTTASGCPGHGSLGADAVEEDGGRLVCRVLRDELAAEGALEDGAAQRGAAALRTLDRRAEGVDRPEPLDESVFARSQWPRHVDMSKTI